MAVQSSSLLDNFEKNLGDVPKVPVHVPNFTNNAKPPAPPKQPAVLAEDTWTNPTAVIIAYNRPEYLQRTVAALARASGADALHVLVAQDGDDAATAAAALAAGRRAGDAFASFHHWQRDRVPDPRSPRGPRQPGTAWLAQHYRAALEKAFALANASHVVVIEDDLEMAPDSVDLFRQTVPLLSRDPTLWCVSSWNDNGFAHLDRDPRALFRTSFFPGLGWMLPRSVWAALAPKWPLDHWDHWMRSPVVSEGRDCIAPEVARNRNIGERGVTTDPDAFNKRLATIPVATATSTDFGDLSYLERHAWEEATRALVASARRWEGPVSRASLSSADASVPHLIPFRHATFPAIATALGIHDTPRAHYRRVLRLRLRGRTILLVDAARSPLAPASVSVHPPAGFAHVAAMPGQSCTSACSAVGPATSGEHAGVRHAVRGGSAAVRGTAAGDTLALRCVEEHFEQVNHCGALQSAFPCENGCGMVIGDDVPNYVADPRNAEHAGRCLYTERASTCGASHWSTSRLCPCAP